MSDNLPQVSDYLCYDVVEANLFFSNGDSVPVNKEEIEKFSVSNIYSVNNLPAFLMTIRTDNRTYLRMMSDKTDLTIHLRIEYYIKNHSTEEKGSRRVWFNKKFDVYIEEDEPNLIRHTMDAVDNVTKGPDTNMPNTENSDSRKIKVDLGLFDTAAVNTAYAVGGGIFGSANMETAVVQQLSSSGASNVLMQPFDNKSSYPQIIVPPYTLVGRLNYLNSVYGFYNTGMMLFFGLDRTYLISKDYKAKCFVKNEIVDIILLVREEKDEMRLSDGSRLEPEQRTVYINVSDGDISFKSNSIYNNVLQGSCISEVVTQSNSIRSMTASGRRKGNTQKKFYHNKFGNPYALSEYVSELSRDDRVVTITFQDVNLLWFLPNKRFKLTFVDSVQGKDYNTELMLMSTQMTFNQHGDHFRIGLIASFKQVKK